MTKKRKGELPSGNIRKKFMTIPNFASMNTGILLLIQKQGDKRKLKNIYPLLEKLSQKQTS